jgi:hypothetical protein
MKRILIKLIPVLLILIVVATLFGKTLIPPKDMVIYGGDLKDQFYYWKSFYSENIKSGIIPFWNPYIFSGTPFLAHPSVAALYPFQIIFILFPLHIAFSIYLYIHIVIAGFAMYWFARLRWDKITSLAGAFIYSLSGMFAARVFSGHVDIISTLVWIPLVFGSISHVIEKPSRKNILFAICALTIQILAGYQFVVFLTLILCSFYLIFSSFQPYLVVMLNSFQHLAGSRNTFDKLSAGKFGMTSTKEIQFKITSKQWFIFFCIIAFSFGIAAVQILPTMEFVRNSIRKNGLPYDITVWGSYTFETFKLFFNPNVFGSPLPENYTYNGPGPNFYELSYYIGIIPLILIGIFIIVQVKNILTRKKIDLLFIFSFFSFIFFALMALGKNFWLHKFFYDLVPPMRLFRFPCQYLLISVFILSTMTCIFLATVKNIIVRSIFLILIVGELLIYSKPFYRLMQIPTNEFNQTLINTFQNDQNLYRITPDYPVISFVRKSLDNEAFSFYNLYSTSGYNPIILDNYYQFIRYTNNAAIYEIASYNVETPPPDPYKSAINFLNTKYILLDNNWNTFYKGIPTGFEQKEKYNGFTLVENRNALTRFFFVKEYQIKSSPNDFETAIRNGLDYSRIALINKNVGKSNCPDTSKFEVKVIQYGINSITLQTNSECTGLLNTSEVNYPGWSAKIDNKKADLISSNLAFRAVFVPSGIHKVVLYYVPYIYYIGLGITTFSVLCVFFILRKKMYKKFIKLSC